MPPLILAMGYVEDGWLSSRNLAVNLAAALQRLAVPVMLHAPSAGQRPGFFERRIRYPRTLPRGAALHLVDQSYGDALLRGRAAFATSLVYVADLAFWRERSRRNALVRRRILAGLAAADARVAMSAATAREMTAAGLAADHIVYPGVDVAIFRHSAGPRRQGRLLHVGSTLPRKGIDRALRFLQQLPRTYTLHQIGGVYTSGQRELIARLGIGDRVTQDPYVDTPALVAAYQSAEAVIFPSRYEGFGFPAVEGRLSGARVLLSDAVPAGECLAEDPGTLRLDFTPFDHDGEGAAKRRAGERFLAWTGGEAPLGARESFGWERAAADYLRVYRALGIW